MRFSLPVKIGAMRGPRSFQVAAELSDGVHHAVSATREAYDYLVDNVRKGAEKAGRDWQSLDIGAWIVFVTDRDSAAAKEATRSVVGLYASSMSNDQLRRNGVDPEDLKPIVDALGKGDLAGAIELIPPALVERLSVGGTPTECVAKLRSQIVDAGVNHLILAITDAALVRALTGRDLDNVATVNEQLQLHRRDPRRDRSPDDSARSAAGRGRRRLLVDRSAATDGTVAHATRAMGSRSGGTRSVPRFIGRGQSEVRCGPPGPCLCCQATYRDGSPYSHAAESGPPMALDSSC